MLPVMILPIEKLAASTVVLGLAVHHGIFIHGEWHLRVPQIVVGHLSFLCVVILFSSLNVSRLALFSFCYLTSLFSSIVIYRLYFHRLSHFPGPKLAAVTKFWHVFGARNSKNHLLLQRQHEKYGICVRTGPNEISIFHPAAIELLDGAKNQNTKDEWYQILWPRTSTIFTRDENDHRERRLVWSQAISTKALSAYVPRLVRLVETLAESIASHASKPIKVNDVMSWFAFDAMGEFAFSEDFGMMKSEKWHPAIVRQHRALALLAPLNDTTWLVHSAFSFVPFLGKVKDWMQMVSFCEERMTHRMEQSKPDESDMASWFINEYHNLGSARSRKSRQDLLSGNSISVIVAGSDTTRATLISIWYFLSKYPENIDKIVSEVRNVKETDTNALALLPHLNGVINETLRLVPPQLSGGGRITGPAGLWVDDTWIPGGTKVTAPKFVISRLPAAFEQPNEFIPERWYSRPELIRDKRAYGPFTVGNRQCVGKNLALVELRLATAMLLNRYNVRFAPKKDSESLLADLKDQVTAQPGECWCIFEPRGDAES